MEEKVYPNYEGETNQRHRPLEVTRVNIARLSQAL